MIFPNDTRNKIDAASKIYVTRKQRIGAKRRYYNNVDSVSMWPSGNSI